VYTACSRGEPRTRLPNTIKLRIEGVRFSDGDGDGHCLAGTAPRWPRLPVADLLIAAGKGSSAAAKPLASPLKTERMSLSGSDAPTKIRSKGEERGSSLRKQTHTQRTPPKSPTEYTGAGACRRVASKQRFTAKLGQAPSSLWITVQLHVRPGFYTLPMAHTDP
jgi:hypothetical protein